MSVYLQRRRGWDLVLVFAVGYAGQPSWKKRDYRRGWRVIGLGVVERKQLTRSVSVEIQERKKAEQIRRPYEPWTIINGLIE